MNIEVRLKQNNSANKFIASTVIKLVTPKVAAKPELLFNKLALVLLAD